MVKRLVRVILETIVPFGVCNDCLIQILGCRHCQQLGEVQQGLRYENGVEFERNRCWRCGNEKSIVVKKKTSNGQFASWERVEPDA